MKMKSFALSVAFASVAVLNGCANGERKDADEMWTSIAARPDDTNRKTNDSGVEPANHTSSDKVDSEAYARKFKPETDSF